MKNKDIKFVSYKKDLKERLKNDEFLKAWKESEPEYLLSKQIIEKRLANKMSQRDLAKKANTTQSLICRIENMGANPSLETIKRIAKTLNSRLILKLE